MKIGLNVGERMIVLGLMPKEGSIVTLKMIRTLVEKLGLSAEQMKEFEVVEDGDMVRWNRKGQELIEFELVDAEVELIKKQLKKMDAENKLQQQMVPVYEKFVR